MRSRLSPSGTPRTRGPLSVMPGIIGSGFYRDKARPTLRAGDAAKSGIVRGRLKEVQSGYCTLKCFILDLSDTGAQLMPADITQCPGELVLKPQIGQQR